MTMIAEWGHAVVGLAGAMVIVWYIINPPRDDLLDRDDHEDESKPP